MISLLSVVFVPEGNAPNPPPAPPAGDVGADIQTVIGWVMWLAIAACVAGIIITAARMAIAHRRGGDADVAQLGWVLGACILIGSAAAIVNAFV
jgi:hypothetical protein